jgi:hypothetical protein
MARDDELSVARADREWSPHDADLEELYEAERHLLYFAFTHARDHLLVTGVNPASEFLDDLTGGSPTNPSLHQSVGNAFIRYFPGCQLLRRVGTRQAQPSACGIRDHKGHAVAAGASAVVQLPCCTLHRCRWRCFLDVSVRIRTDRSGHNAEQLNHRATRDAASATGCFVRETIQNL